MPRHAPSPPVSQRRVRRTSHLGHQQSPPHHAHGRAACPARPS